MFITNPAVEPRFNEVAAGRAKFVRQIEGSLYRGCVPYILLQ